MWYRFLLIISKCSLLIFVFVGNDTEEVEKALHRKDDVYMFTLLGQLVTLM